jgi:phosphoribosyl 1,2-cyclic phosphodiesterase
MDLNVTSLASGSSGNAFLVETTGHALLVEAGLSMRALERHLRMRGIEPASLSGIVVTHEHHDHAQAAGPLARRYGIPLISSAGTAQALATDWKGLDVRTVDEEGVTVGDADIWGVPLPHDAAQPLGLLLAHGGYTLGLAIDLGHVPPYLAGVLAAADLVIVEANHDRERLMQAPYTWPIKNRIMSQLGHLSNTEAAHLLAEIGTDGRKRTAWLAHLSERANDHPQGVMRLIDNYLRMSGVTTMQLDIALRNRPSAAWRSGHTLEQRTIFDPVFDPA